MPPSDRPRTVLVYDGDCGFCLRCARLLHRIAPHVDVVAWQEVDLDPLGLTQQQVNDAVQWVGADGTVRSGHQAIATLLRSAGGVWQPTGRLMELPGISWMAASAYRTISKNRHRLPGSSPACAATTGRRRQPERRRAPP